MAGGGGLKATLLTKVSDSWMNENLGFHARQTGWMYEWSSGTFCDRGSCQLERFGASHRLQ